jgi:hypothetical protein
VGPRLANLRHAAAEKNGSTNCVVRDVYSTAYIRNDQSEADSILIENEHLKLIQMEYTKQNLQRHCAPEVRPCMFEE